MLLTYLMLLFLWLFASHKNNDYPYYQKPTAKTGFKHRKKPRWVINQVIKHKAYMEEAGCRAIAASFNRRFGDRDLSPKN